MYSSLLKFHFQKKRNLIRNKTSLVYLAWCTCSTNFLTRKLFFKHEGSNEKILFLILSPCIPNRTQNMYADLLYRISLFTFARLYLPRHLLFLSYKRIPYHRIRSQFLNEFRKLLLFLSIIGREKNFANKKVETTNKRSRRTKDKKERMHESRRSKIVDLTSFQQGMDYPLSLPISVDSSTYFRGEDSQLVPQNDFFSPLLPWILRSLRRDLSPLLNLKT